MKIAWHGVGPEWPTGYGTQTAQACSMLAARGHELRIYSMTRRPDPLKSGEEWDGIPVIEAPGARSDDLAKREAGQYRLELGGWDPDLIIVLNDPWQLTPHASQYTGRKTAIWFPVDCEPASSADLAFLEQSRAMPVAMSLHGVSMLTDAGYRPWYIPHGIDTRNVFTPGDRETARGLLGIPADRFAVGIVGFNIGSPGRKAFPEQFQGFAKFHAKHKDTLLLCHTNPDHPEGFPLRPLAAALGIDPVWPGNHAQPAANMANWYRSVDVLLNCSMGEGFGLPVAEALACGTRCIVTDCSALTEKIPPGAGWLTGGQGFWVPQHRAWWTLPSVSGIAGALELAYAARRHPGSPRAAGLEYDQETIADQYWLPVLKEMEEL